MLLPWLEERCHLDLVAKEKSSVLFEDFLEWYTKNISKKGISQTRFGRAMALRFKKIVMTGGYKGYAGVSLR